MEFQPFATVVDQHSFLYFFLSHPCVCPIPCQPGAGQHILVSVTFLVNQEQANTSSCLSHSLSTWSRPTHPHVCHIPCQPGAGQHILVSVTFLVNQEQANTSSCLSHSLSTWSRPTHTHVCHIPDTRMCWPAPG